MRVSVEIKREGVCVSVCECVSLSESIERQIKRGSKRERERKESERERAQAQAALCMFVHT